MDIYKYLPENVQSKYNLYNFNHAVEIITQAFPDEWNDLVHTLSTFSIAVEDLTSAGGAETNIPGKFNDVLIPRRWKDVQIRGDLNVSFYEKIVDMKRYAEYPAKESTIPNFITGQIDYLKGRVAICLEWNKKDLAFDRTLSSLRTFYECSLISVGIIITRDGDLTEALKEIKDDTGRSVYKKYGSSTTWTGRLLPKLEARQAGGCPVLVVGIRKECIEGYV